MAFIKTPRLILRNFVDADAEALFDYLSNPTVNCFKSEKLNSITDAKLNIVQRQSDKSQIAVALEDDNQLIGHLFAHEDVQADTYSVGWHFNPKFGGKGYATEAVVALFDELFINLNARRLYAYIEVDNSSSQRLAERLEMRYEGTFIDFVTFIKNPNGTDKYENTQQFAILKREWNKIRNDE